MVLAVDNVLANTIIGITTAYNLLLPTNPHPGIAPRFGQLGESSEHHVRHVVHHHLGADDDGVKGVCSRPRTEVGRGSHAGSGNGEWELLIWLPGLCLMPLFSFK